MRTPLRPVTVLIIEDDLATRNLVCTWLRRWAGPTMRCVEVETITDACQALQAGGIDLVILDWRISATHPGLEVISLLRKAIPFQERYVPIDIISGAISDEEGEEALAHGADAYWQKDGSAARFLERVVTSWEESQSYRKMFQALHVPDEGGADVYATPDQ